MRTVTRVLIVGAGPTGLMLANQLGRRAVDVRLIDRHSGPAQQTRAMAVHARTLEIYRMLGIDRAAIDLGKRGNGANVWSRGHWTARVPLEEMGKQLSAFPYVLMLGQDDNEQLLGEKLRDWKLRVEWNTELIRLDQKSTHVVATLRDFEGKENKITADYVAGCDGVHSAVRQLNGIGFPGAPYEHSFFVADTSAVGPMIADELNVYLWRDGFHLFFPIRGQNRWRVIGIVPEHLAAKEDLEFDELSPDIVRKSSSNVSFKSCDWFSTYRISHRCTERFRDRRCFLLGDAAHVHSPMGGQGMNTGLQDAYNLAWKLDLVVAGRAQDVLLDSYETERMQVAHTLLRSTDRAFRWLVSDRWSAAFFRTQVLARVVARVMTLQRARQLAFRTLSQIGISYRTSELSHTTPNFPAQAPQAGERFPWIHLRFSPGERREDLFERLGDLHFSLLVFGQPAVELGQPDSISDSIRIYLVPQDGDNRAELERVKIPSRSYFLLRPDGHIGLAGIDLEAAQVHRWFRDIGIRELTDSPE